MIITKSVEYRILRNAVLLQQASLCVLSLNSKALRPPVGPTSSMLDGACLERRGEVVTKYQFPPVAKAFKKSSTLPCKSSVAAECLLYSLGDAGAGFSVA